MDKNLESILSKLQSTVDNQQPQISREEIAHVIDSKFVEHIKNQQDTKDTNTYRKVKEAPKPVRVLNISDACLLYTSPSPRDRG